MGSGEEKILISVITVCYNSEGTIRDTLESMLNQTYEHYEYLIVDGASRDGTVEILKSYEERFQGRMRWISEPDSGIYDAMNKGIGRACGELIGILNSDDFYERDALLIMAERFAQLKREHVILYGFQRNLSGNQEKSVVLFHHTSLDEQMITHPTCFVSRQVYRDFGMFDTSYKSSADYEFMLRIFHEGKVFFQPVYEIITNFRLGGMSGSEKGYRESARLMYRYHSISRLRYMKIIVKSLVYEFFQGIRRR
ncbi:MAG: glycosyltransferase [Lachnospiraceae bacterium]|nr:glycosyltransferase [Lachnospiraceae bacterium]